LEGKREKKKDNSAERNHEDVHRQAHKGQELKGTHHRDGLPPGGRGGARMTPVSKEKGTAEYPVWTKKGRPEKGEGRVKT